MAPPAPGVYRSLSQGSAGTPSFQVSTAAETVAIIPIQYVTVNACERFIAMLFGSFG